MWFIYLWPLITTTTDFFDEGVKDAGPKGRLAFGGKRPTSSTCTRPPPTPYDNNTNIPVRFGLCY